MGMPKTGRKGIRSKRLDGNGRGGTEMTFDQFMEGNNKTKYVTREQLVMYSQFQFREQVVPMIGNCIKAYDHEVREKRWYRAIGRWLRGLFVRKSTEIADLPADARQELREQLDAAETEAESPEPEQVRTCITCGSTQLEPVNEKGGLQCGQCGGLIEEPPPDIKPTEEETPDGSPTHAM